ncbi:unnamed protein product [Psylliodes chrysocephalus]|uniref:Uncharacterized protein n=1 Tax=Psylliodes chrysocephalus TaxID=3402493 RepID=A0A9P0GBK3_9CUCU|nr:unnamed protein product [Psylliodes chrysocephala]
MLNCVNTFDQHLPVTEQAGLVVAEEKTQHDSFPNPFERPMFQTTYNFRRHSAYATVPAGSEHSSRAGENTGSRPPPPLPPPRFPNSAV